MQTNDSEIPIYIRIYVMKKFIILLRRGEANCRFVSAISYSPVRKAFFFYQVTKWLMMKWLMIVLCNIKQFNFRKKRNKYLCKNYRYRFSLINNSTLPSKKPLFQRTSSICGLKHARSKFILFEFNYRSIWRITDPRMELCQFLTFRYEIQSLSLFLKVISVAAPCMHIMSSAIDGLENLRG